MRHVVPVLLALVMLLPAAAPAAAGGVHCQTGNGPRTLDQIGQELYAVGFNGPWQVDAIMQAYARTTGDAVSCDNGLAFGVPAPAAPAAPHAPGTLVLFIGGLDSTPSGNDLNFGLLADELVANWGYQLGDLKQWFYGANGPYTAALTCQPIATSEGQLVTTLQAMRDAHVADSVVLVGHSLGGVIAFEALGQAQDLVVAGHPFVRRVVTVDSPLGGLAGDEALFGGLWFGDCPAFSQLRSMHTPARQQWLTKMANWELVRGVDVEIVSNPEDTALWLSEQQINANVNFLVDAADSGLNHAAVLKTPQGVAQLAPLIGPQAR